VDVATQAVDVATKAAEAVPVGYLGSSGNALTDLLVSLRPSAVPLWTLPLVAAGIAVGIAMAVISLNAMFGTWLERKVSAHIQCRYGPMRAGWHGFLQPLADGIKLMLKEDMIPKGADRTLFVLAPAIVLGSLLAAFTAYPLAPNFFFADIDLGLFFILACSSTTTIGVIMAGWSSNSKWSLYGAMREAAQVVAYEIPLGVSLLVPLMVAGSFNLINTSEMQQGLMGMNWFIFRNPIMLPAFVLFFIAILAETKRAPFDLPETESELVSGFLTEYSGIRWSFFFMEEYAAMYLFSAVGSFYFFGGFESPLTWAAIEASGGERAGLLFGMAAAFTLCLKSMAGLLLMMWVRWTLPRVRIDQVMTMGYKYLTPLALACVLLSAVWEVLVAPLWRG
ncbi:MAG: NADH-quinone oxidoreductase subunit H, partial [Planctomycetota bacterium]